MTKPRRFMSKAMRDVRAERRRQVNVEGYDADHDARHFDEDLLEAGLCYLWHCTDRIPAHRYNDLGDGGKPIPMSWPWQSSSWKPKDKRRDLVRAGALFLADQENWSRHGLPKQDLTQRSLDEAISLIEQIDAEAAT